ncbi:MAG TPA: SCP2 sterol-binding domain-containing protein [Acidiferrobacteraceae bacterium]|nr:SCP2 sterol-binding domain-containing protein [Acidiferrobacteraceae bacterium]
MFLRDLPVASLLSGIANAISRLDPEHQARARALAGRRIALILGAAAPLLFVVKADGSWDSIRDEKAELSIRVPASALVAVALGGGRELTLERMRALGIEFDGDAELARALQGLLRAFRIDWEEPLSQVLGDVPAYHAGKAARGIARAVTEARTGVQQNLADWLQFDSGLLPVPGEVDRFIRDAEILRDDVARLAARIALLKNRAHAAF